MAGEFDGKVVVVTGAGRGIGKATAARFANEGASVALIARSKEVVEAAAREVGGVAFVADVADHGTNFLCMAGTAQFLRDFIDGIFAVAKHDDAFWFQLQ